MGIGNLGFNFVDWGMERLAHLERKILRSRREIGGPRGTPRRIRRQKIEARHLSKRHGATRPMICISLDRRDA